MAGTLAAGNSASPALLNHHYIEYQALSISVFEAQIKLLLLSIA